ARVARRTGAWSSSCSTGRSPTPRSTESTQSRSVPRAGLPDCFRSREFPRFLRTDDFRRAAESKSEKGAPDDRSQAASRKVRVVRARLQGRQEGAGVLRRGARLEG